MWYSSNTNLFAIIPYFGKRYYYSFATARAILKPEAEFDYNLQYRIGLYF